MILTVNENGFTIEGKTKAEYDAEIRAKAIEEFEKKLKALCNSMTAEEYNYHAKPTSWASAYEEFKEDVDEIAKELKGSEK